MLFNFLFYNCCESNAAAYFFKLRMLLQSNNTADSGARSSKLEKETNIYI
jgi:hypothetical protein